VSQRVRLRDAVQADLPTFFEQQLDADANHMAAFVAIDPADQDAFMAHWAKVMADKDIFIKTILFKNLIAGYVSTHGWFGEPEVSYWLGKPFWGQGVATAALKQFLQAQPLRPLHARVVKDNAASIRVLEKCGFTLTGEDKGFSNARQVEVEELIMKLE